MNALSTEWTIDLATIAGRLYYGRSEMTAICGKSWHFASLWERNGRDAIVPFALLSARRAGTNEVVALFSRYGVIFGRRKPNSPALMTVSHNGKIAGSLRYELPLPWFGERIAHLADQSGEEFGSIRIPTVNSRHARTNSVWTWGNSEIKPLFYSRRLHVESHETPENLLTEADELVTLKIATLLREKCRAMFKRQPEFETPLCEEAIPLKWNQVNPPLGLFAMTWVRSFR